MSTDYYPNPILPSCEEPELAEHSREPSNWEEIEDYKLSMCTLQTTTTTTTTTSSSSSSYHYYPSSSVSGGREDSRVLCPATILVFIQNTHIDSWAENPTTYPSRVECSKVLCPDREFYALDTQCCRGRVQCESNCDYQCTCHRITPQTQI